MARAPPIRPRRRQLRGEPGPAHRLSGLAPATSLAPPVLRTILALSPGMPRDEIQGLFFLLGLLLAFYLLTPFLALAGR